MPQTCTGTTTSATTSFREATGSVAGRRTPPGGAGGARWPPRPQDDNASPRTATDTPQTWTGSAAARSTSFSESTGVVGRLGPARGPEPAGEPEQEPARGPARRPRRRRRTRRPVAQHRDAHAADLDGGGEVATQEVAQEQPVVRVRGGGTSEHGCTGDQAGAQNPSDDSTHSCHFPRVPRIAGRGPPRATKPCAGRAARGPVSRGRRAGGGARGAQRVVRAGRTHATGARGERGATPEVRATRSGPARPAGAGHRAGARRRCRGAGHGPVGCVGPVDPEELFRAAAEVGSGAPATDARSVAAEPYSADRDSARRVGRSEAGGCRRRRAPSSGSAMALVRQPGRRRRPRRQDARPRSPRCRRAVPPGPGPGRRSWSRSRTTPVVSVGRRRRTASVTGSSATTATSRTSGSVLDRRAPRGRRCRRRGRGPSRTTSSADGREPTEQTRHGAGEGWPRRPATGAPRTRAAPTAPPTRAPRSSQRRTSAVGMRPRATSPPQRCRRPPGAPFR